MANQTGAYPGFSSMKRVEVFLLPPGWDASPSQGHPQHMIKFAGTHLYTWVERGIVRVKCPACPRTQHNVPGQAFEPGPLAPESSALTMRPPRLPHIRNKLVQKTSHQGDCDY